MTAILEARHVSYTVDSTTLINDVSLAVIKGHVLAVVGPNGAGKSTLLHLLSGDKQPSSGTIELLGRGLQGYSALQMARLRAVMSQHTVVHFAFLVDQIVAMGRYPHGSRRDIGPSEDRRMVRVALERTEMLDLRSRPYPTLSGGEAARTILARAIAQETEILLLDEPTSSLDIRFQELVMGAARAMAGEGKAVVVILHDLNLAAAYADEIALLDRGKLAALGSPADTLSAALLSEVYGYPIYVTSHPRRNCPLVLADGP